MKARIKDYIRTFDRTALLTFETAEDVGALVDELRECDLDVEIKKHRKKRSLDANAYCWVLIGKLAAVLRDTPDGVYRRLLRDVGGNYDVVPVREDRIKNWERIWCSNHIGRFIEDLGPCVHTEGYHNVRSYCGSSDYDTVQMSRLIDSVVEECREQRIETMTPDELELLKARWTP